MLKLWRKLIRFVIHGHRMQILSNHRAVEEGWRSETLNYANKLGTHEHLESNVTVCEVGDDEKGIYYVFLDLHKVNVRRRRHALCRMEELLNILELSGNSWNGK